MAASLSAYWVKFFKGAGFPQDVATKHAVVFSNNRIKPDMLPDLDKPSLKEMGITLMGDMIAILRYAKKVVEETTCERFLVDSEDSTGVPKVVPKPIVKKVAAKMVPAIKTSSAKLKPESVSVKRVTKVPSTLIKKTVTIKKPTSASVGIVSDLDSQNKKQTILKRKLDEEDEFDNGIEDQWNGDGKKMKTHEDNDNRIGYNVIVPTAQMKRSNQILKKSIEQKRTVFDRLGDSSVTSTTNLAETSPMFNITGLGKEVFKRSASVFNRLGDKDIKKDNLPQAGILKTGTSGATSSGILKPRSPTVRTSVITVKKVLPKTVGTMRADQEVNKKVVSRNMKQIVKTTKKISFDDTSQDNRKVIKSAATSGKLASERLTAIPAKARLGLVKTSGAKQVTFDRLTTVSHLKKPTVFSRLGV